MVSIDDKIGMEPRASSRKGLLNPIVSVCFFVLFLACTYNSIISLEDPRKGSMFSHLKGLHVALDDTKSTSMDSPMPKILVVYSGPSTMTEGNMDKNELYMRNFEFFLRHGIDCKLQDTILVLGKQVAPKYKDRIEKMDFACRNEHSHSITILERENVCYDMESVRLVMHGNVTDILAYDYFIYLNCGLTGPMMPKNETTIPWTSKFIDKMVGNVTMVGISHLCSGVTTHVQSMIYCLDKRSMKLIKESNCVFDCRIWNGLNLTSQESLNRIINQYERGMGRLILNRGYAITSLTRSKKITKENRNDCTDRDLWMTARLNAEYNKIPSLDEVMFFKTSRILTKETAEIINFTGRIWWNW